MENYESDGNTRMASWETCMHVRKQQLKLDMELQTDQWTMWFQDISRDHANKNAWAGTPQNQITFAMLTDTGQFDAIEAQILCPPLLHRQLKTVALKAWDKNYSSRKAYR